MGRSTSRGAIAIAVIGQALSVVAWISPAGSLTYQTRFYFLIIASAAIAIAFSLLAGEVSCLRRRKITLEPISKLLKQHGNRRELHKAEEVGGVIFPANQQPPLPLEPRKEPFDEPATLMPPPMATVLGLEFSGGPVRRDHVH